MKKYKYTAFDSFGNEKSGTLHAEDMEAAHKKLRGWMLFPSSINDIDGSDPEVLTTKSEDYKEYSKYDSLGFFQKFILRVIVHSFYGDENKIKDYYRIANDTLKYLYNEYKTKEKFTNYVLRVFEDTLKPRIFIVTFENNKEKFQNVKVEAQSADDAIVATRTEYFSEFKNLISVALYEDK